MTTEPGTLESAPTPNPNLLQNPQLWGPMLDLPCDLTLELPIPAFTVADLLRMQPDTVLDTKWDQGEDVPVRINGEIVAWAEFEAIAGRLGLRITEWA
ncbi:MAG TPA: FliM/FliN family flagellar motor C-terminal domain-containing protein [Terriglobales bacterium]